MSNTLSASFIIPFLISFLFIITAVTLLFFLIINGINHTQITNTLIGLIIISTAWAVIKLIETIFEITILADPTILNL